MTNQPSGSRLESQLPHLHGSSEPLARQECQQRGQTQLSVEEWIDHIHGFLPHQLAPPSHPIYG